MHVCNSLILSTVILLAGPDPDAFIAVTKTLTSLSTAGKLIIAIGSSTVTEPFVIFSPK